MNEKIKTQLDETDSGTILFNVPFPKNLESLKDMSPIVIKQPYHIDYIHSYGQDTPFFAGLANKKLLGSKCSGCGYVMATPKGNCIECGAHTDWIEFKQEAKLHAFTVCHFGAEAFLPECPFILGLVELEGANTLFLTRILGLDTKEANLNWIGMKLKAKFRRNSKFNPTDVYFVPVQ